jgi:type VI secretion system secreted protein VgrG
MKLSKRTLIGLAAALSLYGQGPAAAATIMLGSAAGFAVLGASTVTNTGATTIKGDLGVSPGTAITGLGSITLTGTEHAGDSLASAARADALSAYLAISGLHPVTDLTGVDLGGLTLTAGVYEFSSSAQLTGTLTLKGPGQFAFLIGSTLTTANSSSVDLVGGANPGAVYWDIGSSATLGGSTAFEGTILATASITLDGGAAILGGRAIALNGAVTMINNTVSIPAAPEISTWAMMLLGFGTLGFARAHRSRKTGLTRSLIVTSSAE